MDAFPEFDDAGHLMSQCKITVKVFEPLLRDFDMRIRELHLKRDAFLDRVISVELPNLEKDLQGKHLSPKARQYIARKLKRMGTLQVNVVISAATAGKLRSTVGQANIVRDAFINRIIYLLRASDKLLDYLKLPHTAEGAAFDEIIPAIPVSPINALATAHADPLAVLRHAVNARMGIGLYLLNLPDEFSAFACYLDDSAVPGVSMRTKSQRQPARSVNELEALEDMAFTPKLR